jgi:phosphatidate cytidylyltransferase
MPDLDIRHLGPTGMTMAALFVVLIVASIVVRVLTWTQPQKDYGDLIVRTRSWWIMIGIFVGASSLGRTASVVYFGIVSFLALKEFLTFVPTRRADRRLLLVAFLAIPVEFYWIGIGWYGMFIIFIPVYMFMLLPALMVLGGETKGFIKAAGTLHWGLMACVFAIGHAAYLLVLPVDGAPPGGLLLYLLILTEGNDVAQYVWGKIFGERKIVSTVSPKKTVAGFLGGVATTAALGSALAAYLTPFGLVWGAVLGGTIAVAGFLGDVTISAVKRDIGIKDMGKLIPGHGGVLDRIDSLVFAAPLFFHIVRYFWT